MTPPSLTPNAIEYGRERLFDIAGVQELDVPFVYGPADTPLPAPGILILPAPPDAWQQLLHLPPNSLDWLPAEAFFPPGYPRPFDDALPVLFWGEGRQGQQPVRVREDGSVVFQVDILAAALFMLTRWEETILPDRDQHDRFPATASVAYRQGFLDQPIVDRYAMILRAWLQKLHPNWQPPTRNLTLRLSHDIDHLRRFLTTKEAFRQTAHDAVYLRRLDLVWNDVKDYLSGRLWLANNPYLTAIDVYADLAESVGTKAYFYIMATTPGPYDEGFDIHNPTLLTKLRAIQDRGHIVGLHPGYRTYRDLNRYQTEKAHLERALNQSVHHARQHYLRFQVPFTWRIAAAAGIKEDTTLGYADHEGFRCGTSYPYPVFDILADELLPLTEHPLHMMDSTLMFYRNLTPQQGFDRMERLARRVAEVGGELHLLWHNTALAFIQRPWFDVYRQFLLSYTS